MQWANGRRRAAVAVVAVAAAALVAAGCGSDDDKSSSSASSSSGSKCAKTTKIRMGISPFQDTYLAKLPEKFGWYERACLDVEFVNLEFAAQSAALAGGSIDTCICNTAAVISIAESAPQARYLYPWDIFDQGAALMGRKGSDLKSVKEFEASGMSEPEAIKAALQQLKGKKVVMAKGTDVGANLTLALRDAGVKLSDIKVTDLDFDPGLAAFIGGEGDAYIGGIPQRTKLVAEGFKELVVGPELSPPPLNGWASTQDFWDKNKDAMLALQNVTFMAIRYTEAHEAEVGKYITGLLNKETAAGMTVKQFMTFFQGWEHYPLNAGEAQKMIFEPGGLGYWKDIWDHDNEYFVNETKQLKAPVPADPYFQGEAFQQAYVEKYGADEKGWWKTNGTLN
jgi:NitT/TauT family transport system substrate-binding protein